jgi:diguanylate cyclase (GGDEF)-like protein/PAS domain S-box-containing protein
MREVLQALDPKDRAAFEAAFAGAAETGAAFEIGLRANGTVGVDLVFSSGGRLGEGAERVIGLVRELSETMVAASKQEPAGSRTPRPIADRQGWFRLFVDAGAFRSWIKDEQGRYVFANRLFADIHGLAQSGELDEGLTDYDLFPTEIAERLRAHDDLARAAPAPIEIEEEIVSQDGKREFFLVCKFGFSDVSGARFVGGVAFDITSRKELELALRNSESHFRSLADLSPVPIVIGVGDRVTYVNPAFTRSYGYGLEDIPTAADWYEKAYPDEDYRQSVIEKWQASLQRAGGRAPIEPLEAIIRVKSGGERSVIIGTNFLDDTGKALIGTFFDITEARAAEDRIRRLGRLYAASSECQTAIVHAKTQKQIFAPICDIIVKEGVARLASISLVDHATRRMTPQFISGRGKSYLEGIHFSIDPADPTSRGPNGRAAIDGRPVWCQDFANDPSTEFWRERAKDYGWGSSASLPIYEKGRIIGVLTLYFDAPSHFDPEIQSLLIKIADSVSFALDALAEQIEHEAANRQIEILAHYDSLTGLPNRRHFMDALEKKIREHALARNAGFAVHFIDLDNFKDINDTLGHVAGDKFLVMVAKRLRASIREADIVCRLGGDEFVVIQAGVRKQEQAARFAEKLIDRLQEPYNIEGNRIASSGSIGIAIHGPESPTADLLVSHADVALYRAKAQRGSMSFFTEEMDSQMRSRVELIGQLQRALDERQLFLVYQPQIDTRDGRVIGVEALARWAHPTQGVIGPTKFIPLAEESGLIIRIGDWILNEACRQLKEWIDAGVAPPVMCVNVSPQQIKKQLDFAGRLGAILKTRGIAANRVEMELTENVLLDVPEAPDNIINRLRSLGVRITLDDFGTGFSSLEYLSKFPVDRLKIAQKFVADVASSPRSKAIVEATVSLADRLRIAKIVEGVENEDQLDILEALGCEHYQGNYFSPPLSPEQARDFLIAAAAI